ncbi:DUF4190 domain-containing protein [Streptomyces brasiliscabiei]|uniref:DUF4190 domain-containing protein n=1 Tax=Streptomyces brasiliscabiei TaxID=2736302 RepID=A0ABU8GIX6_9ACTN
MATPPPHGPRPYQPWGQPWGQAWGQPYPAPVPAPPVNGLAIAALVLGALCFLPGVGLLLGVVALVQIRRKGERGKGMAVTGIVLSVTGALLLTLAFTTGGARDAWDGFRAAASGGGTTFSVARGECFDSRSGSLEGYAYDVDIVPCEGAHDAEVFAGFTMPDGAFPGDDAVTGTADDRCYALSETYVKDTWALPADVDVYHFTPTRESWRYGDREVTCMFGSVDPEGSLTGSLRRDATNLDDDQLAFLEADALLDEAYDGMPATEYVEDDLAGHRTWASEVAGALERQASALRAHDWEPAAGRAVGDYADALDRAREEWEAASGASDADAFSAHWDKAYRLTDGAKLVTAREALGLATEPPAYDDEDTGDGGGEDGPGAEV